jgi:hypothetical protein
MADFYYIQDSRQYVGNSMLWWALGGGYTTDIIKAQVFTEDEAKKYTSRETDILWDKEEIDKVIKCHVDIQYCNKYLHSMNMESVCDLGKK